MAATLGSIGYKSKAYREDSANPGTFLQIIEVKSIDPAEPQYDEAEFTHLESPSATKEFKPTMKDPGEVKFTCNAVQGNAVQQGIESDFYAGTTTVQSWRHEICDNVTGAVQKTYTYPAYIKSVKRGPISTSDPIELAITIRVTGAVVIT